MKLYECIVDDGKGVFKTIVAVKDRKELFNTYGGNGEFIRIKDVTKEYPIRGGEVLDQARYGETEKKLIDALIEEHMKSISK